MQVEGARFRAHEVWRPDARLLRTLPAEALRTVPGADRLTWLKPKPETDVLGSRTRVNVLQALDELFACSTPHFDWTNSLGAKNLIRRSRAKGIPIWQRQVGQRLALQETRRRQKFDCVLVAWADYFGLLGVGNDQGDYVPDIFCAAKALRAWAVPESEIWFAPDGMGGEITPPGTESPIWVGKGPTPDWERRVNALANSCRRPLGRDEWEAPSLWAAMCHVVRNADMLGVQFAMCSADDCFNPYVASHGKRAHCSKRCANRAREQRLRLEQTLSE